MQKELKICDGVAYQEWKNRIITILNIEHTWQAVLYRLNSLEVLLKQQEYNEWTKFVIKKLANELANERILQLEKINE